MKGCDHSTGGAIIGAALKAAGYVGVFRYATAGRGSVNITPAEISDLHAHGLEIGIVCEGSAAFLLGGTSVGFAQAQGALAITRVCGLPDGVVYMAADFDATHSSPAAANNTNCLAIANALIGAADVLGPGNVGLYGGYFLIDWMVKHGPADLMFWQCESAYGAPGLLHPAAAAIQQLTNPIIVDGVQVDADDDLQSFWGQRGFEPPPSPEEIMARAMATDQDGHLNVFVVGPSGGKIWFTWQSGNAWQGGEDGVQIAGLQQFAVAPPGLTFTDVAAAVNGGGDLNVTAGLSDDSTVYCFLQDGEWSHDYGEMSPFCPSPV